MKSIRGHPYIFVKILGKNKDKFLSVEMFGDVAPKGSILCRFAPTYTFHYVQKIVSWNFRTCIMTK